jgi:hypothetical protein
MGVRPASVHAGDPVFACGKRLMKRQHHKRREGCHTLSSCAMLRDTFYQRKALFRLVNCVQ